MTTASACGKTILFGEHAVVYGRPALAVPLARLRARVAVDDKPETGVRIEAGDMARTLDLTTESEDPLAALTRLTLQKLHAPESLGLLIRIQSDIPIAGGLGSGAAVATALVRALSARFGRSLSPAQVSALVFESEKLYHGTPSGIDNAVIAYEQAIRFTRAQGPTPIHIARSFALLIADTGVASPTRLTVGDLRRGWQQEPARYEPLFDQVAVVVDKAEAALARGLNEDLGPLMTRNQELLEQMGVSSTEIEELVHAALAAGAGGAKLSGSGRGGNVIVFVEPERAEEIREAILRAGAKRVITTEISPS